MCDENFKFRKFISESLLDLRIDNRRQGVLRATLLLSAAILSTISYYMPNCSLSFSLSNHIDCITIKCV